MTRQIAVAALLCAALTACTAGADDTNRDQITVLAAASLSEAFTDLETDFEADHPGIDVRLAFGSSATLAQQVESGAPADVLATADPRSMEQVTDLVTTPTRFARNQMVLAVPKDNPARIDSFDDLDDVTYVACVVSAPCGNIADQLLEANRINNPPSSLEIDVKAVLSKVTLDEADAGLVYETDAIAAGEAVKTVAIPGAERLLNDYLVATVKAGEHPELAQEWVALLTSRHGREVLAGSAFLPPGSS